MTKQKKSKNETGLWKNRSVSFLCTIFLQMPLRGVLSKTKRCAKPPVCSFTSEKKKTSKCVRNSCVTAVERHRGWRMELLTGAGTGLVNLLFIPFLHLLFPSLSHFRCASHSKRGSLIRGVCVCVGTLCTCVYVGERQRERETLGNRCVFFLFFLKPSHGLLSAWVFLVICKSKRITNSSLKLFPPSYSLLRSRFLTPSASAANRSSLYCMSLCRKNKK